MVLVTRRLGVGLGGQSTPNQPQPSSTDPNQPPTSSFWELSYLWLVNVRYGTILSVPKVGFFVSAYIGGFHSATCWGSHFLAPNLSDFLFARESKKHPTWICSFPSSATGHHPEHSLSEGRKWLLLWWLLLCLLFFAHLG